MSRIVPLILAVALFMEMMDSTVIATSLPAIAADIGTSPIALKLAFTTYLVALAIFIPASGWVADRFGAKRVFLIAIAVFIAGSVACIGANSLPAFVGARFLQGMGGSMMTPIARLVLVRATERSKLVEAMAWLTIPALMGPLAGPVVGGFLTTYVSWHWIFIINVPIGLIGMLLSYRFLPEIAGRTAGKLDTTGFVLSGLAASGIVFGLSVISLPALPTWTGVAAVVAGIASGIAYVAHARRTTAPVLDLGLFRAPTFRIAISTAFLTRLGIGAIPFLLPLTLQLGFGLTAFHSGLVVFVGAIGSLLVKFATARIYARLGFKRVLLTTILVSGLSLVAMGFFSPAIPLAVIYAVLLVAGFFRSLMFTGFHALVFDEVEPDKAGAATAIAAVMQQVGLALGVAVAGMLIEISLELSGSELGLGDFQFAFLGVAALSLMAVFPMLLLDPRAGASISGHGVEAEGPGQPT